MEQLAGQLVRAGLDKQDAISAVKNWQHGLFKPIPSSEDVKRLATALGVEPNDIAGWCSTCRYAPFAPRKARLVTQLIAGRTVQDALDILKFTRKRAAEMISKDASGGDCRRG